MKLYISGDMEGVAGVSAWQQVDARTPHPEYARFQHAYTHELLSAIEGARAAEPCDVLVNDAHGPMRNVLLNEFPSDVRILFGNRKPYSMVQNAHEYEGAFFVGYHGAIGDRDAVLCHTYTPSVVYDVHLNGVRCSEATINAALLGAYGVSVLMASGDRTTVEGIQAQLPWVEGAIVKEAIGAFACDSLSPHAARRVIREAAERAVRARARMQPYVIAPPIDLEVRLAKVEQADLLASVPEFVRRGARTIAYTAPTMPEAFRAFVAMWRLGALA